MSTALTREYRAVLRVGYLGAGREKFVDRMNKLFGEGSWTIGYVVEGKPITREDALGLYQKSYTNFLQANPEFTERLLREARDVYDTNISNTQSGFDWHHQEDTRSHLQDIAVRRAVRDLGREFAGTKLMQIRGQDSDLPELNPGRVPFVLPECISNNREFVAPWIQANSVEDFWQNNKFVFIKPSDDVISRLRQSVEETLTAKRGSDWKLTSERLAALTICGGGNANLTQRYVDYCFELWNRPSKGNSAPELPAVSIEPWITDIFSNESHHIAASESTTEDKINIIKALLPAMLYSDAPFVLLSMKYESLHYQTPVLCALADGPFPLSDNGMEFVRLILCSEILDRIESDPVCRSALRNSALAKMEYSKIRETFLDCGLQREHLDEKYKQRFLKLLGVTGLSLRI